MTRAQYDAIHLIAEEHGRIKAHDLNIRLSTMKAMAERRWIAIDAFGFAVVTDAGWNAVSEI